jgi:hypothetical protein
MPSLLLPNEKYAMAVESFYIMQKYIIKIV